jgi:hypothetical protein
MLIRVRASWARGTRRTAHPGRWPHARSGRTAAWASARQGGLCCRRQSLLGRRKLVQLMFVLGIAHGRIHQDGKIWRPPDLPAGQTLTPTPSRLYPTRPAPVFFSNDGGRRRLCLSAWGKTETGPIGPTQEEGEAFLTTVILP